MAIPQPRASFERLRRWLVDGDDTALAGSDAPAVASLAIEQGLAGLLHGHIVAAGLPWPHDALGTLRQAHRAALARGERQLEGARRTLGRLAASGLRALPLKGIALAEHLYDSVADRPMADVDILALDDWPAALRVLREQGYRELHGSDHATALADPDTGALVELHREVTSCGALFPLDREALWAGRESVAGRVGAHPGPEHQLLLLSLHAAFQHGLALRVVQFLDFRRLFERSTPAAPRVLELAREARAETAVALSLEAAAAVVGCAVPGDLREGLAASLPRPLETWLARRRARPELFLNPAAADLLRLRWALARGRRVALLRHALLAGSPEPRPLGRLRHAASRAISLAWRWRTAPSR
jgi:hypothetical protein